MKGKVNGQDVCMLRDTGCTQTMVRANLVKDDDYITNENVEIRLADGSVQVVPVATVHMECRYVSGDVLVGVLGSLPEQVLLGNDLTAMCERGYVVTRGQARTRVKRDIMAQEEQESTGVTANSIDTPASGQTRDTDPDSEIPLEREKLGKSLVDKGPVTVGAREDQGAGDQVLAPPQIVDAELWKLDPAKLRELQQADITLQHVRDKLVDETKKITERVCFYERGGLLYRKWASRKMWEGSHLDGKGEIHQLVVPKVAREGLLRLAHDIPLAGHLGSEKTKDRLLRNYYWPGIFRDVARYCASCTECQKTAKRQSKNKAELIPMPVIEEPFRRIAMDMVGPLPRSKAGNRHVLVVCDYATRYPEAIPVKSMEADVIADELVAIFSRMGLPDEILSDQGTNFTSKLMRNVCELLKIHKLQTSPYHPQCNGLVERFNGTLMLSFVLMTQKIGTGTCRTCYSPIVKSPIAPRGSLLLNCSMVTMSRDL